MNVQAKSLLALVVSFMTIPLSAFAANGNYLSVEEAVGVATQNNKSIKIAEIERKIANSKFKQTDAIFLPQISLGYTATSTNNPLNAFGFLLQQGNVTAMDFDPGKLNSPGENHNFSAGVDVKMPLLNLDLIHARKAARLQDDAYKYKAQYAKSLIVFEVQKGYTQLQFAYQMRDILNSTLADVKQIYQLVQNFHEQGLVQKSDVLDAQVQVNTIESAIAKAESNILNASDGLKFLMNIDITDGDEVFITDSLKIKESPSQSMAFSPMRADVMAMKAALDASKSMEKSSKMNFLPKINAFGNFQTNDTKVFGFGKCSYLVGVNMSWTILSGNQNRSKVCVASLSKNKAEVKLEQYKQKSELELNKTYRDLQDLQVEMRKQQASVEQASEALRILKNRYSEGLVSTTDLLASQAQLSKQRLALAQTVMEFNIKHYYQQLLTNLD